MIFISAAAVSGNSVSNIIVFVVFYWIGPFLFSSKEDEADVCHLRETT